jgi:hypothetical protein
MAATAPGPAMPPAPTMPGRSATPPGYVADNQVGMSHQVAPASTAGLRKAAITLFWVVTAATAGLSASLFSRRGVWDDFVAGAGDLDSLDRADATVAGLVVLIGVATLAAAVVVSIWSLRVVRNAQQLSGHGLSPKMACGGWYIPIGNLWVPFVRLREAVTAVRGEATSVSHWQAAWIAMAIFSGIDRVAFELDSFDPDDVRNTLTNEANFSLINLVVVALTAFLAQRAMGRVEAAVVARGAESAAA